MKYKYLVDKEENKQGDIVQMRQDFWSRYYTTKGIIVVDTRSKTKKNNS